MIEKALYDDLEEILELQKLAYQSEAKLYDDFKIQPLTQTIEELRQDFKNQIILKKVIDRKIVGSIRAYEKEGVCYIGRVIVHLEYQNKGIGRSLMKNLEKCFSGCNKYSLFTGKKSLKNLYFYDGLGYQIIKEKKVNDKLTLLYLEKIKK